MLVISDSLEIYLALSIAVFKNFVLIFLIQTEDLGITDLMERMKRLTEEDEGSEMTQEELLKQFEKVEHQTAECKTCFAH